ncbi:hypothetical protein CJF31_00007418 [Rutstroemia sp. NJR-2017a BVV2]|nr:hypothetical protein CJF31_00007418 [Rutstroemia sp. NJR-2017a BVV2]
MENAEASANDNNSLLLPRTPVSEAVAFEKLLNAMYSKPTVIEDSRELHDMTRLADFYCALPVLSTSLYISLWNSPKFLDDIRSLSTAAYHKRPIRDTRVRAATRPIVTEFPHNHPVSLLKLAAKLRHPILFREMMVYVVSLWESNCSIWEPAITEAGLDDVLTKSYHAVHHLQASVFFGIFRGAVIDEAWRVRLYEIASKWEPLMATHKQMEMAFFCDRLVWQLRDFESEMKLEVNQLLTDLLKNNLVLSKGKCIPGHGDYFHQYLCAEVKDDEFPWDPKETDW